MDQTDDELMHLIAKGDKVAFRSLFNRHAGHLLGYAQGFVSARERAEDITQEAWLKVVKLSPHYKAEAHFVAWLYTLTRNLCLNFIRGQKRLVFSDDRSGDHTEDHTGEPRPESDAITTISAEDEILRQSDLQDVRQRLGALPENQRVALMLHAVDGLSYEDIASELATTVSAVKSLIFRARQHMRPS